MRTRLHRLPRPSRDAGCRGGFTMVELMITIAIVGILAAIAVPYYLDMQLKAKRSELPMNVDGIRKAEIAYEASFDDYLELPLNPRYDSELNKETVLWNDHDPNWQALGWAPDGEVRGNYQVGLSQTDHPGIAFLVTARSDVDDDDALCEYTATENQLAQITELREFLY